METDSAPSQPASQPPKPQPPRPRGKVFDVMRPGKAPASPTSRPVVIGHKAGAQAAQLKVSGIGAPESTGLAGLSAHKNVTVRPAQDAIPAAETVPAAPAHAFSPSAETPAAEIPAATRAAAPANVPSQPEATTVGVTEVAAADAEQEPSASASAPAAEPAAGSSAPAAEIIPPMPGLEDEPDGKPVDPAKLDEAALDPLPPAPMPSEQESHVSPVPTDHDDAMHDMAPPNLDGQIVVGHHTTEPRGTGKLLVLVALMVLFLLLVFDLLLDVGLITVPAVPHTNLF